MRTLKIVLLTIAALALAAAAGAAVMVYGGLYNVAATRQHTQPVFTLLELAMRQSVRLRARDVETPSLDDERMIVRGAACFRDKCVQCHGAPGVPQGDIGKSMQPLPGPLVDARHHWRPRELYWVTKHGIKMSGMPAWEFRLADEDLWAVVAFMDRLPDLTPRAYAAITQPRVEIADGPPLEPSCRPRTSTRRAAEAAAAQGDVRRGAQAMYQYACNACHTIPGITGSNPNVGPALAGMAGRAMIGGKLGNTPDNMVRWLRHTREVDPLTAMPEMGVTEEDAHHMAAFLATLR